MGCILSPDRAKLVLDLAARAIAQVCAGTKVWGRSDLRRILSTLCADDWAGTFNEEQDLQAAWGIWKAWAAASECSIFFLPTLLVAKSCPDALHRLMNSPHNEPRAAADGGTSPRKRPAEAPADDNNATDVNQVVSNTATQCSAEIFPITTSHTHPITTPESSVTSSRHEHRSHNGIVEVLPKGWSLHESAYFDAQQVTLQDLHRSRSASADHIDIGLKPSITGPERAHKKTLRA